MPRILVLYGTTNGHTAKVANAIADTLRVEGNEAHVVEARARVEAPEPGDYDAVIIAASVHAGGYQKAMRRWVQRHAADLREKPSAFVSVCLGVLQHDAKVDRDLDRIMERFVEEVGWTPTIRKVVAGALPWTRYNWITRLVMRRIIRKTNGDLDMTRDFEYTNWRDLEGFTRDFHHAMREPAAHVQATPAIAS